MNYEESLKESLETSQEVLEKLAKEKMIEIGTALAGVIKIAEDRILIFNVGDCRVYRILPYSSVKLSRDHTVVENLLQEGNTFMEEGRKLYASGKINEGDERYAKASASINASLELLGVVAQYDAAVTASAYAYSSRTVWGIISS